MWVKGKEMAFVTDHGFNVYDFGDDRAVVCINPLPVGWFEFSPPSVSEAPWKGRRVIRATFPKRGGGGNTIFRHRGAVTSLRGL